MIWIDIDEFQKGVCEECGTFTYRRLTIAEYQFYICDKCTEILSKTLKLENQIFTQ